jgi:hypothetical protein
MPIAAILDFVQDTGSFRPFPEHMLYFFQRNGPRTPLIRLLRAKRLDISNIDRLSEPERRIGLDFSNINALPSYVCSHRWEYTTHKLRLLITRLPQLRLRLQTPVAINGRSCGMNAVAIVTGVAIVAGVAIKVTVTI